MHFSLRKNNRSNSLERRKSGEGESIINQSTVHGIASPNRRPTIFDVFRPRSKSDAKRKERELAKAQSADKDSSASGSSTHSGTGIMHSMKAAVQNTIGQKSSDSKSSSKYRDGSAHPHGGSDAQYYHTVTAVRRLDHAKSPMTKMMDLFRHRSNSATSEADKRKAVRFCLFIHVIYIVSYPQLIIDLNPLIFLNRTESSHNASTSNGYTECNNAKSIG